MSVRIVGLSLKLDIQLNIGDKLNWATTVEVLHRLLTEIRTNILTVWHSDPRQVFGTTLPPADSDDMIIRSCNYINFREKVWSYLGIKLLQERLLGCRHHGVQVGLEGFKLLSQKHTETNSRNSFLIENGASMFLVLHMTTKHQL